MELKFEAVILQNEDMDAAYPKLSESALYNAFNKYRFKLGLPRCGFHDLRRALGTSLVTTGTSVTTVAQVLGHRNLESTKQYISLDTEHLKEVGLNLGGFMPEKEGDVKEIKLTRIKSAP